MSEIIQILIRRSLIAGDERKFGHTFKIEVDGGVNLDNAPLLVKEGVNILVAGSFVFSSNDPLKTIADLKTS